MCEPITKNFSVEDQASNADEEIFLDANDDIESQKTERNNFSEIARINPETNVIQVKNCSGDDFIDLTTFPTEHTPKRIINDTFIVDEPYELVPQSRTELPKPLPPYRFSVWSYIKEFVGKDLTKITLPACLNEPLSALQRPAEAFSYPEPFKQMIQPNIDPVTRLEYVAAHYAITNSSQCYRLYKPFNPLLGETYELRNDEKGFVFVAEQVSHHPPIMAMLFQLPNFRGYGVIQVSIKFWGNSADAVVEGGWTFEFFDSNEKIESVITYPFPTTTGRNIIFGDLWIEKHGTIPIINHTTGHKLYMTYKKKSWFNNRDLHAVEGVVVDKNGKELRYLYGHWTSEIWSCSPETYKRILANPRLRKGHDSKLLVKANPRPPNSEYCFNLPLNSLALNDFREGMYLPRTDVRYRPDIRCLENGDLDGASAEKHRLEEKQRAARKLREAKGEKWTPLWFEMKYNPYNNSDEWTFNYKYFEQNFDRCPDIF
ncbi:Oxysterol-binding protein-related protein 2 [Oopsacas minuta]|uniref:Oxysterol-binding protein-related protein 2 n=1 Tax=Oopsacas minuta TaxID=111878 RepID=A0AAV7JWZ5_9METZ|nr:Oxysterol-binding protein-related protein 2 [Oopsacas minuta]